jgi:pseudaminic acid cytidylyltransferase
MNLCVIPARGGSKRIPRKNIKLFAGKPIIAYSIEAAQASGLFSRIIVSTDDADIAAVAKQFGGEAPFMRPKELADDHTGILPVLRHTVQWFVAQGETFDYVCSLMATAPLVQAELLTKAFDEMVAAGASGATTVTTFPSCIFRALKRSDSGVLEMVWSENFPKRSQDFPEVFHDAGQFSWLRVRDFPTNPTVLPENLIPVMVPRQLVQDIDTPEDWEVAEQLYFLQTNNLSHEMKAKKR